MVRVRIVLLLAVAAVVCSASIAGGGSRGVRTLPKEGQGDALETFDPQQSAALFVGVRRFPDDKTLAEVRYAVDDAVDLAFLLAMDAKVPLINPGRVVLALSGEPQKPESRQNLNRLVAAGARVRFAGQTDVLNALDDQARAAGRNGLLLIAFATHGVSSEGTQYLLTATSVLRHRETTLSENEIRDIASRSDAARSLILIDACRERLTDDRRNGAPDLRSVAPLIRAMAHAHGQVVLEAAAAGQYAYDDDERRNGVFTAAVIDGLRCGASPDARGLVTVDTLSAFVEERVLTWIRKHRDVNIERATQMTSEGGTKNMPLAACRRIAPGEERAGCTISIGTAPIGATVNMDGRNIGATPLSIRVGKGQSSRIALVKSGYKTASGNVDCTSDSLFITLQRSSRMQLLLSERFQDNHNNWFTSKDPEAPAGFENGAYILGSKAFAFRFTVLGILFDPDADFEISATVRRLRGGTEHHFGLLWGALDRSNFYYFTVNGEGNVEVGVLDKARRTVFNDQTAVNRNVRTNTSANRLRIVKFGKRLRLFVNDGLVHEMAFQPFFGPGVGLAAFNGPIVAAYSELTVEGSLK